MSGSDAAAGPEFEVPPVMLHEFEVALFEAALPFEPDNVDAMAALANAYTRTGRFAAGLALDQQLATVLPENPTVHYNLACSLSLLHRTDEAFEALLAAIELGFDDERLLASDPDLENLRRDPRFRQVIAPS